MKVIRNIDDIKGVWQRPCVTIGNFDGVHLGHQHLLQAVRASAERQNTSSVVVTFDPHPLQVLRPEGVKLLAGFEQKKVQIALQGIDGLVVVPFTREFASLPAEIFVQELLVEKLGVSHLFIGYDYVFGRGREGDSAFLARQGGEWGFELTVIPPFVHDGDIVSSTRIRGLIREGRMAESAELLGRNFQICGKVTRGRQIGGRDLGYPTANIYIDETTLVPRKGVYACEILLRGHRYGGVANIGCNPTIGDGVLVLEAHIFDFDQDIYGETIAVDFLDFLRVETRFADLAALKAQIDRDAEGARQILSGKRL